MKTRNLRQTATFSATPHEVYEALMDSKKHARFSGSRASISRRVGGKFTAYGGDIEGTNIALVPDRKIVQKWRIGNWPKGHYSVATFALSKTKGGTKLAFTQTGIPSDDFADIKTGWTDYYWEPMEQMFLQ